MAKWSKLSHEDLTDKEFSDLHFSNMCVKCKLGFGRLEALVEVNGGFNEEN